MDDPILIYMGTGVVFALLALPALFIAWPMVGPAGMLLCFVVAFGCIFRAIWLIGSRQGGW